MNVNRHELDEWMAFFFKKKKKKEKQNKPHNNLPL